jgi:hypothetical protein
VLQHPRASTPGPDSAWYGSATSVPGGRLSLGLPAGRVSCGRPGRPGVVAVQHGGWVSAQVRLRSGQPRRPSAAAGPSRRRAVDAEVPVEPGAQHAPTYGSGGGGSCCTYRYISVTLPRAGTLCVPPTPSGRRRPRPAPAPAHRRHHRDRRRLWCRCCGGAVLVGSRWSPDPGRDGAGNARPRASSRPTWRRPTTRPRRAVPRTQEQFLPAFSPGPRPAPLSSTGSPA